MTRTTLAFGQVRFFYFIFIFLSFICNVKIIFVYLCKSFQTREPCCSCHLLCSAAVKEDFAAKRDGLEYSGFQDVLSGKYELGEEGFDPFAKEGSGYIRPSFTGEICKLQGGGHDINQEISEKQTMDWIRRILVGKVCKPRAIY